MESTSDSAKSVSVAFPLGRRSILDGPVFNTALPFIIGGFSGIVATTCIQPIDMVKVRLQLAGEGAKGRLRPSSFQVAREIIAQGGIINLYSGLSAGYLRQIVYGTALLGLFDTFIGIFEKRVEARTPELALGSGLLQVLERAVWGQ